MGFTESEIIGALRRRFTKNDTWGMPLYVHGAKIKKGAREIDFIAVKRFAYDGLISGFEIKTSRADYLRELRDLGKHEEWAQHCHEWWLVTSDPKIVRDDLPENWGHMTMTKTGKLRVVEKPAYWYHPVPLRNTTFTMIATNHIKYERGLFHEQYHDLD